ncbi:prolyl aminopeptidase [Ranunculus cassubicifolius]
MISPTHSFFIVLITTISIQSLSSPITISLTPKSLRKSGDSVQIQWTGIDSPSKLDWIGIYSPPNSSHSDFIGYIFLSSSCPNWQSGSCSTNLSLVNLRSNYEFRLFRWTENEIDPNNLDNDHNPLPGTKHLLGKSGELGFVKGNGPEQIHLSFTSKLDEIRVMFITDDGKESFVKFGRDEDELEEVVKTDVRRYEREDMCDSPANTSTGWRDPGFIHDGVLRNLKNGKKYYYKVGSDEGGWSMTHSFISRDEDSEETNAFLFGDMGTATPYSTFARTQDESSLTIKWILRDMKALRNKPAFVSHIGDISYARGYSWLWDTFFNQVEPVASKLPYHVCIGNHEYDWPMQPWKPTWSQKLYGTDGGGECGVPYSLKFNMPGNSSVPTGSRAPATRNLYYSFDEGVVHFVYMSTETDFLPGSIQYDFLKHDLENVDREKTPFVVFQGHRPMYTSSMGTKDVPFREKLLEHIEPLLVKNKVTLVLWGHVHRYERFCAMKNYTCANPGGEDLPIHVVIGMGGQDWQPTWAPRNDHPTDPVFPQPKWSLFRTGELGYTRLFATKEKLILTYVGNHDGEAHDRLEVLAQKRHLV